MWPCNEIELANRKICKREEESKSSQPDPQIFLSTKYLAEKWLKSFISPLFCLHYSLIIKLVMENECKDVAVMPLAWLNL